MSTRQRERLASESAEEREARLQQMRDRLTCVCAVAEINTYRRCASVLTIIMDPGLFIFICPLVWFDSG